MRNFLDLICGRRKETKCAYAHMWEMSEWKSRPRGPEHYATWERQLNMLINSYHMGSVELVNVDKAKAFIKHINGVE